jgi:flavin reductase (DIM6/NTAB) family NADH-FMN oxidoreductase RutF
MPIGTHRSRRSSIFGALLRTHLECILDKRLRHGSEIVLFGRIVAASVDAAIAESKDPFQEKSFVYLGGGTYA